MTADAEEGFATLVTLTLCVALLALSSVLVLAATAAVERHRAEAAADLAAVSAAAHAGEGERRACRLAETVTSAQGARLTRCDLAGPDVLVEVQLELPGRLRPFGPVRARARAGPPRTRALREPQRGSSRRTGVKGASEGHAA